MLYPFPRIPLPLPRHRILHRLGFRQGTEISGSQKDLLEEALEEAQELILLQGSAYRIGRGDWLKETGITLRDEEPGPLERFLGSAPEILLMGATAGPEISREISRLTREDQLSRGVILDAAASEMVDQSLTWIQQHLSRRLIREGVTLGTRRFSAGYGNLPLTTQKDFIRLLSMERWGVSLTPDYLMLPEKSVTALTTLNK